MTGIVHSLGPNERAALAERADDPARAPMVFEVGAALRRIRTERL